MPTALITGINGFVGPHLKHELETHGYEVFGLGRQAVEAENYYAADITDAARMQAVIKEVQPTHIFHLANISSPAIAEAHSDLTHAISVDGTINLFEAARRIDDRPRVLIVSSAHVYGEPEYLPIDERHPLRGHGVYAAARLEQEQIVQTYQNQVQTIIVRSFNHTGPGQPDTFVIPKIVKQIVEIKQGKRVKLELGNVNVKRDISDVRDVARAYRLLLEQDQSGFAVNVCRGQSIGLKEVIESVKVLAGLNTVEIALNQELLRAYDVPDIYGDRSLLTELTGWQPEIPYEDMLREIYRYWKQQLTNNSAF